MRKKWVILVMALVVLGLVFSQVALAFDFSSDANNQTVYEEDDYEDEEDYDEEDYEEDDYDEEDEDYEDEEDWEEYDDWEGALFVYRSGGANSVDGSLLSQVGQVMRPIGDNPLDYAIFMGGAGTNIDDLLLAKPCFYLRDGYTFTGWSLYSEREESWRCKSGWCYQEEIDEDGEEKILFAPGADLFPYLDEVEQPVLVYANWRKNTYILSFDGGEKAKGQMLPRILAAGESFSLPSCEFTRKGYSFSGWRVERVSDGRLLCETDWLSKKERKAQDEKPRLFEAGESVSFTPQDGQELRLTVQWEKKEE